MTESPSSFLELSEIAEQDLRAIVDATRAAKAARKGFPAGCADADAPLEGRILAMIFEKPSTRTRLSFDVGMRQLGGETIVLSSSDLQVGRGETLADTAQVLSRMVDLIMMRTGSAERLNELAAAAHVPVINGLTDNSHPCQIMADIVTLEEKKGPAAEQSVAWVGDGNNVLNSWIHAAQRFGFELRVATPPEREPDASILEWSRGNAANVLLTADPREAVAGATCIVTDCWVSMGDDEDATRHNILKPYQVNESLMSLAADDAIFMHCLPAHRGEEVTAAVIDGPQSVVFDEAENRLHAQKAIMRWCLGKL